MAARPKIAAISIKASISSFELNTGNLCVKMDKSITPADQTSIAVVDQPWFSEYMGARNTHTDSLVGAFEQYFGCAEPPRARSVGLDCRSLVLLRETNTALAQLASFAGVIDCLFDGGCIIRLGPVSR